MFDFTAQVTASEKRMQAKYDQAQKTAVSSLWLSWGISSQRFLLNKLLTRYELQDEWYRRAELALSKGDEELAREALTRKKAYQENADMLKSQLQQQGGAVETIVGNMRTLESKLAEAKMKKDTLKARAQSAKSARAISDMVGGLSTGSALSAFEKMEEKVLSLEAEADAATMVSILQLYEKLLFCLLISAQINANYIIIAAFCSR